MTPEQSYNNFSKADRSTASQMAKAMRDGLTTRDELIPEFGKRAVDKLGEHAAALAHKAETLN